MDVPEEYHYDGVARPTTPDPETEEVNVDTPEEAVAGPSSPAHPEIPEPYGVLDGPRNLQFEALTLSNDPNRPTFTLPFIIAKEFLILEDLAKGSFGTVFKGLRISRPGSREISQQVAVKVEDEERMKKNGKPSMLEKEHQIYNMLEEDEGFSEVFCQGVVRLKYPVMVMELHGQSLDSLIKENFKKFTLKTVLMLAIDLLDKLKVIHSKQIIHRDIKPSNIVIGKGAQSQSLFLIDFGLAKFYEGQTTPKTGERFCGTMKYCSLNAQLGVEQMFRDDLESLIYTLVYLSNGDLPWNMMECSDKAKKLKLMKAAKADLSPAMVCLGLPGEFAQSLYYCRGLQFTDTPNYEFLKRLFMDLFSSKGYTFDRNYDWVLH